VVLSCASIINQIQEVPQDEPGYEPGYEYAVYTMDVHTGETGTNYHWCADDLEYAEKVYADISDEIILKGYFRMPTHTQVYLVRYANQDHNEECLKGFPYDPLSI